MKKFLITLISLCLVLNNIQNMEFLEIFKKAGKLNDKFITKLIKRINKKHNHKINKKAFENLLGKYKNDLEGIFFKYFKKGRENERDSQFLKNLQNQNEGLEKKKIREEERRIKREKDEEKKRIKEEEEERQRKEVEERLRREKEERLRREKEDRLRRKIEERQRREQEEIRKREQEEIKRREQEEIQRREDRRERRERRRNRRNRRNRNRDQNNRNQDISQSEERRQNNRLPDRIEPSKSLGKKIFKALNQYRKSLNLRSLKWNKKVYTIAFNHDKYMEKKKELSHDNFSNRMGSNFRFANENVAMFGGSLLRDDLIVKQFIDMWKKSDGHNKNMIETRVRSGAVNVLINFDTKEYYSTMILVDDGNN